MNDSPGWASPGSPSGEPDRENGPGTPQDSAPPNWSKQQPPAGQWSAPGQTGWGPAAPPPPPPPAGTGWGQPQGWQQPNWGRPPSPKPGVIPLRPLGVGEILDGAVSTMRAHWRTVLGVSLVVALVTQTTSILLQGFVLADNSSLSALDNNPNPSANDIASALSGAIAGGALTLLITLLGVVIATAMLTMVISRAVLGRPVTTREAWTDARPQLLRLLGLTCLLILIAVGILAVGITPGILIAVAGSSGAGIAVGFLGAVASFVVIAWLLIRYTLSSPALMLEKQGVFKAMARSAKLVRGSWWRMFGIQLLSAFLVYMVSSIVQIPFVLIAGATGSGGLSSLVSGDSGYSWASLVIIGIGAVIGSTITFPISAGVTALLYMDQRIRREALDIELARAAGIPGYGETPADSTANGG
ncbi:glycerophosphoryl diester phosphodiesterase membrane domain-containing protein [Streptomyces sp. NPDC059373]